MYDGGKIITGLVIALVILTFPVWWNLGSAMPPAPDPVLAPNAKAAGKCILPKDQMKTTHMQILDNWRNAVVRDSERFMVWNPTPAEVAPELLVVEEAHKAVADSVIEIPPFGPVRDLVYQDKQQFKTGQGVMLEMSLQNTCMNCHTSKKEFCDQCHNYTAVSPFCWDCHVAPKEKE